MEETYWERLDKIRVSINSHHKINLKKLKQHDKVYHSLKYDIRIKSDFRIFLTKVRHVKFALRKLSLLEELPEKNHNGRSYNWENTMFSRNPIE